MNGSRYVVVEQECCGTCVHYRQHYILSEQGRPWPLWYGHCVFPRLKARKPDETCPHWTSADKKEDLPD